MSALQGEIGSDGEVWGEAGVLGSVSRWELVVFEEVRGEERWMEEDVVDGLSGWLLMMERHTRNWNHDVCSEKECALYVDILRSILVAMSRGYGRKNIRFCID